METTRAISHESQDAASPAAVLLEKARDGSNSIYCAGAVGGFLIALADLTKADESLVTRLANMLGTLFNSPAISSTAFFGLVLVVVMAGITCWIFEPKTKPDAFARGLSIFALLNLAPLQVETDSAITGAPAGPEGVVASASWDAVPMHAALPGAAFSSRTLVLHIETHDIGKYVSLITLRDPVKATVLFRDHRPGRKIHLKIPLNYARVRVEIETPGHRRVAFIAKLSGQGNAYRIHLKKSKMPLGVQQLYGFEQADFTPVAFSRQDASPGESPLL